jgi:hypothetical protein
MANVIKRNISIVAIIALRTVRAIMNVLQALNAPYASPNAHNVSQPLILYQMAAKAFALLIIHVEAIRCVLMVAVSMPVTQQHVVNKTDLFIP